MLLAVVASIVCLLLCVAVHLGVLMLVYRIVSPRFRYLHSGAVGMIVLAGILGHLLEIAVFAVGYAIIAPADIGSGFDLWYHSAAAYTSLGDSRLSGAGWRLMTAVEALTGLVLIAWTASFTFVVMQRNWAPHEPVRTFQLTNGVARTSYQPFRIPALETRE